MPIAEGDRDKGRVITGSSNLTQAGLQDNLEFNVELKNRADYDFAIAKFNELWAVAVDVSKPCEDTVVNKSPFASFTPYELYYTKCGVKRPTHHRWRRAKAWPEPTFRYFSNSAARSRDLKEIQQTSSHGRYLAVWKLAPSLWLLSRARMSSVRPM